jgi:glycine/D-amino acid oxidase-like deaminating enzyme
MIRDLLARARRLGVVVHTGDPVTAVVSAGRDVTGVQTRSGHRLECDHMVICCGRWTDELLGLMGLETRLVAKEWGGGTPVSGLLVVTEAVPDSVSRVVSVDDVNYRPETAARTMLWSAVTDRELLALGGVRAEPEVPARLAQELLEAASRHVPALRSTRVRQAMTAMRALPTDGLPIVGRLPDVDGPYIVLAHAGVTLAPALANAVVAEVVHGHEDDRLARFRPDRLPAAGAHAATAT